MRSHRSEARRRLVAHDLGLFRRAMRFLRSPEATPFRWDEVDRLGVEQRRLRALHPWLVFQADHEARAISRGRYRV